LHSYGLRKLLQTNTHTHTHTHTHTYDMYIYMYIVYGYRHFNKGVIRYFYYPFKMID